VTAMQRTHRGHQRDTGACLSIWFHCTPERRDRPQNLRSCCHDSQPCRRSVAKPQYVEQGG